MSDTSWSLIRAMALGVIVGIIICLILSGLYGCADYSPRPYGIVPVETYPVTVPVPWQVPPDGSYANPYYFVPQTTTIQWPADAPIR